MIAAFFITVAVSVSTTLFIVGRKDHLSKVRRRPDLDDGRYKMHEVWLELDGSTDRYIFKGRELRRARNRGDNLGVLNK